MIITAHSGCDETKMNSYEYLNHVLSLPVDAIELDLRMGPSDKLLLSHDPIIINRTYIDMNEAFEMLRDKPHLINCDLKEYNLEEKLFSEAEQSGIELNRLVLTGSVTDCMCFQKRNPGVEVFINAEELISDYYGKINSGDDSELEKKLVTLCRDSGYKVINIDYKYATNALMTECKREGIDISLWTVDDPLFFSNIDCYNMTTNLTEIALKYFSDK